MKKIRYLFWTGFLLTIYLLIHCSEPTIEKEIIIKTVVPETPSYKGIEILVTGGTIEATYPSSTHEITISSFYMDQHEVSYFFWEEVKNWAVRHGYIFQSSGSNGISMDDDNTTASENHPVAYITWKDAIIWCNAYSEKYQLTPCYYTDSTKSKILKNAIFFFPELTNDCVDWTANGYRLPTEAEWEFAARDRGVWNEDQYSGSADINECVWYSSNSGTKTHACDDIYETYHIKANNLGLYDLCGNVWEMCWDRIGTYDGYPADNPHGLDDPECKSRMAKGGSCLSTANECIISSALPFYIDNIIDFTPIGFRTVRIAQEE